MQKQVMDKQPVAHSEKKKSSTERIEILSEGLQRAVQIDLYRSKTTSTARSWSLLLVNDGQDMEEMAFGAILSSLEVDTVLSPVLVVGIHCGEDRKNEYGMSGSPDYMGRGAKADKYEKFILSELIPRITSKFPGIAWKEKLFAGFSLGALSAFDIVWNHPDTFSGAGVFSGSLWWRSVDKNDKSYNSTLHRLMHQHIRKSTFRRDMRFFFECGELDEWEDRNRNGVIDSIDDTIDLMRELLRKGYLEGRDFAYLQLADGKHDVASWARAIPPFLRWAFPVN